MALKERYANSRPFAVYADSAFSGVVLLAVEYGVDDMVIAGYEYEGKRSDIRRHKIYTTAGGRHYIRKFQRRYYLDDFISI